MSKEFQVIEIKSLNLSPQDDLAFQVQTGSATGLARLSIGLQRDDQSLLLNPLPAWEKPASRSIQTSLGKGKRVTYTSLCRAVGNHPLRLTIVVDQYPEWPEALILQIEIENQGGSPFTFDHLAFPSLALSPSWASPTRSEGSLWTLQGAAVEWGMDFAFPLPIEYERQNPLGHRDNAEAGGVPLNYIWNETMGLALALLDPLPTSLWMPLVSYPSKGVSTSLEIHKLTTLAIGQSYRGSQAMLSLHHGDFYKALAIYRQVTARLGRPTAAFHTEDFAPAWCSWGYEFDVRPEEVLGVLPVLKELGIHWLTLDDRWFDAYGDWNPRTDTFTGGADQIRSMVVEIHAAGAYAQLWWYPLAVEDGMGGYGPQQYMTSRLLQDHPDWLCLHADGSVARNNRGLAILCPALLHVQQYILEVTRRFIQDWDFDGHKLDNIYTVPACYNPLHQHKRPDESVEAMAKVYSLIFGTTRALKSYSVTQICSCGTTPFFTLLPYTDQAVTADPTSSAQIRQRVKFYKGLLGSRSAVFADHIELSDGAADFASEIGVGGIPSTKFVWPHQPEIRERLDEYWLLTDEKEVIWKKWFALYNRYHLSDGEYLDLYDLAFHKPETHLIRKQGRLYYAFFAPDHYIGPIELRGLEPGVNYQLTDYENSGYLGTVQGSQASLDVDFFHHLLLEASQK